MRIAFLFYLCNLNMDSLVTAFYSVQLSLMCGLNYFSFWIIWKCYDLACMNMVAQCFLLKNVINITVKLCLKRRSFNLLLSSSNWRSVEACDSSCIIMLINAESAIHTLHRGSAGRIYGSWAILLIHFTDRHGESWNGLCSRYHVEKKRETTNV